MFILPIVIWSLDTSDSLKPAKIIKRRTWKKPSVPSVLSLLSAFSAAWPSVSGRLSHLDSDWALRCAPLGLRPRTNDDHTNQPDGLRNAADENAATAASAAPEVRRVHGGNTLSPLRIAAAVSPAAAQTTAADKMLVPWYHPPGGDGCLLCETENSRPRSVPQLRQVGR
eukprot:scaffold8026_cov34-Prasinocladus_malaysianus.AAC.2